MLRIVPAALVLALLATAAHAGSYSGMPGSVFEERFVAEWDRNGDGVITRAEIMRMPEAVFARFDRDGDGLLDPHETARFDAARQADLRNLGGRYRAEVARMAGGVTLRRNDIDGNGRISRAEFRLGGADWLALLDRDGNGAVSAVDFAAR
ncbi:EF-hand domain-containing protein [Rhodovulum euryhalinum]|uniref:EF hand domain-containing protein n=1 Tax=Rhodovulum euryhalinum TaxID=35805 RepID=A0A4V2SB25_9RHOB|nr:EF-hand domain-containing protein [Rhodovulum euryhalinum]TCO73860.1 EF hand domain-containing protein [Rhodovulum euryhalinum]